MHYTFYLNDLILWFAAMQVKIWNEIKYLSFVKYLLD